jgi:hypothetical protein
MHTLIFPNREVFNNVYKKPKVCDFEFDGVKRFYCVYCLEIKNKQNNIVVKIGSTEVIRARVDRIQSNLNKTQSKIERIALVKDCVRNDELSLHKTLKEYRLINLARTSLKKVHPLVKDLFGVELGTEVFTCSFETVLEYLNQLKPKL